MHHHSHSTGNPVSSKCFTLVDRESQGVTRKIKEAMYICVNDPSLNRNLGNTNSHTYGMKFYRTHHHSSSNNMALPPPTWATPQVYHTTTGGHAKLHLVLSHVGVPSISPFPFLQYPMLPKHPLHS